MRRLAPLLLPLGFLALGAAACSSDDPVTLSDPVGSDGSADGAFDTGKTDADAKVDGKSGAGGAEGGAEANAGGSGGLGGADAQSETSVGGSGGSSGAGGTEAGIDSDADGSAGTGGVSGAGGTEAGVDSASGGSAGTGGIAGAGGAEAGVDSSVGGTAGVAGTGGKAGTGGNAGTGGSSFAGAAGTPTYGPEGPSCTGGLDCAGTSCCQNILVPAGSYLQGRSLTGTDQYLSGDSDELPEHTSTTSAFYLDTFEVTVGRFRKFVAAYTGVPPSPGSGAHPAIPGSGWQAAWNSNVLSSPTLLKIELKCGAPFQTWTDAPANEESKAINCATWYEAFAFCAWDGGRFPTEAEWEHAAAGGMQNRLYPWGTQPPDNTLAAFKCGWDGLPSCSHADISAVGSALGAGAWGHKDLAGGMWEWVFDWYDGSWYNEGGATCTNCANLTPSEGRVNRGGSWFNGATSSLRSAYRRPVDPTLRHVSLGFRCARSQ